MPIALSVCLYWAVPFKSFDVDIYINPDQIIHPAKAAHVAIDMPIIKLMVCCRKLESFGLDINEELITPNPRHIPLKITRYVIPNIDEELLLISS